MHTHSQTAASLIALAEENAALRAQLAKWELKLQALQANEVETKIRRELAYEISERSRVETALRDSETRFRALANAIPTIVWTAAPDGTITYANDEWFRYVGTPSEQNAQGWPAITLHPDDYERCLAQWTEALQQGTAYEIEVRNRRFDGEYRWFLTRAVPMRDAEGQVLAWYGTTTDIHERKQLEQALFSSEERLRLTLEGASLGTWLYDAQTGTLRWDDQTHHILGLNDSVARNKASFFHHLHPSDRRAVYQTYRQAMQSSQAVSLEFRVRRPTGTIGWVFTKLKLAFTETGKPLCLSGVCLDVTQRKLADEALRESEIEYRALFDLAGVGNVQLEVGMGRILRANRKLSEMLGYTESELQGCRFLELVHPDDRAQYLDYVSRIQDGALASFSLEIRQLHKDNSALWTQLDIIRVDDAAGQLHYLIANIQDITTRKSAEADAAFLADLSDELLSLTNPDDVLRAVTQRLGKHLGVERCFFAEVDTRMNQVVIRHDYHAQLGSVHGMYPLSTFPIEVLGKLQAGQIVVITEASAAAPLDTFHSLYTPAAIRALVALPWLREGRWMASLYVTSTHVRPWPASVLSLLRSVATRAWAALENAHLFLSAQAARLRAERAADRIFRLQVVTSALSQALTQDQVMDVVLQQGLVALEAAAGAAVLQRSTGARTLGVVKSVGYPPAIAEALKQATAATLPPAVEVLQSGRALWFESGKELTSKYPALAPLETMAGWGALAAIPLTRDEQILGAVVFHFIGTRTFGLDDRTLLLTLATQCTQALERAQPLQDEQQARVAADAAAQAWAFLAETSQTLARSLDLAETLRTAAHVAIPFLADFGLVYVLEANHIHHEAYAHRDPLKEPLVREFARLFQLTAADLDSPAATAIRTGQSQILASWEAGAFHLVSAEAQAAAQALNPCSLMIVPLVLHEQTVGVLVLGAAESGRHYVHANLVLTEVLARRVVMAFENARLYQSESEARQQAERSANRVERLQTVTAALSQALTPQQVIEVIVQESMAALNAAGGNLDLLTEDGTQLENVHTLWYPEVLLGATGRYSLEASLPGAEAARTGEPLWFESLAAFGARYPYLVSFLEKECTQAAIMIPAKIEGHIVGVISLSFTEPRNFGTEDKDLLLALARQCAQALERARLYEAERRSHAEAEAARDQAAFLAAVSATLASSLDYEHTLQAAVQFAVPGFADWCFVELLIDGSIERKALAVEDTLKEAILREWRARYPITLDDASAIARVIRTGQSALVSELELEAEVRSTVEADQRELLHQLDCHSYMVMPIRVRGQVLGALCLASTQPRRYTPDDLRLGEEITWRVGTALDNARAYRAEQEARTASAAAARASAFLAEAGQALSRSLDYEATLHTLAHLALPYLADVSVVFGYADGKVRGTAYAHVDPAQEPLLQEALQLAHRGPESSSSPMAQVIQTGESLLIVDNFEADAKFAPPLVQEMLRQLGAHSAMAVPLRVREHTVGALMLLATGARRPYAAGDLILVEELARRAAFAAENARLYADAQAWSAELEARVKERTEQLQQLSIHVERLSEEERARIAREVHDELGGALTTLKMGLVRLRREHAADPERLAQVTDMMALIDSMVQTVRRIASDLRPAILDELGLIPALEWQVQEFQRRTGIHCHFRSFAEELELDPECSTAIFRVLQESLTNIARHAHATQVNVTVKQLDASLIFQVDDNGRGITPHELTSFNSLGLVGMRERMRQVAGDFDIQGIPQKGTTVSIRLPWSHCKPEIVLTSQ